MSQQLPRCSLLALRLLVRCMRPTVYAGQASTLSKLLAYASDKAEEGCGRLSVSSSCKRRAPPRPELSLESLNVPKLRNRSDIHRHAQFSRFAIVTSFLGQSRCAPERHGGLRSRLQTRKGEGKCLVRRSESNAAQCTFQSVWSTYIDETKLPKMRGAAGGQTLQRIDGVL